MVRHIRYVDGKVKKSFYRVSKKMRLKKKELKLCNSMKLQTDEDNKLCNSMKLQTDEENKQKCAEHYKQMLIKRAAQLISLPMDKRNKQMTYWKNRQIKFPIPPVFIEELHREYNDHKEFMKNAQMEENEKVQIEQHVQMERYRENNTDIENERDNNTDINIAQSVQVEGNVQIQMEEHLEMKKYIQHRQIKKQIKKHIEEEQCKIVVEPNFTHLAIVKDIQHFSIGGLSSSISTSMIRDLITPYGKVLKCTMCSNQGYRKKGYFAIVTIEGIESAMTVVSKMNGMCLSGQKITVKQMKRNPIF